MRQRLDRKTLGRMKRLVRDLQESHAVLMTYLHRRHGPAVEDESG
jgi:hypothetical protein